jgi:hypothetical protein
MVLLHNPSGLVNHKCEFITIATYINDREGGCDAFVSYCHYLAGLDGKNPKCLLVLVAQLFWLQIPIQAVQRPPDLFSASQIIGCNALIQNILVEAQRECHAQCCSNLWILLLIAQSLRQRTLTYMNAESGRFKLCM